MATTTGYTKLMQKRAARLLQERHLWSNGRRKSDGMPFKVIPGSDGAAWYVTLDHCNCDSGRNRGYCSHRLALVEAEHEQAILNGLASLEETDLAFAAVAMRGR